MIRVIIMALSALLWLGCEAVEERDDLAAGAGGDSTQFNGTIGGPSWAWPENPQDFASELDKSVLTELSRLPLVGEASSGAWSALPWSGLQDSTNARWLDGELSPMQKYDAAYNEWGNTKNFMELKAFNPERCDLEPHDADYYKLLGPAAEWMSRHRGNWAAHDSVDSDGDKAVDECDDLDGVDQQRDLQHAWAAATMVEREPVLPVTVGDVTFWPSDIKALLLTVYDNATSFILNGTCRAAIIDRAGNGDLSLKGCEGTDAGDFHILLTNFVGRFQVVIAMEVADGETTTPRPIDSYLIDVQRQITSDEALALLGLEASEDGAYAPNPDARGWREINLTSHGRKPAAVGHTDAPEETDSLVVSQAYRYVLELDGDERVIGGQWISDEKESPPPSYLWIAQGPRFERLIGKSSPELTAPGNPFVEYSDVSALVQDAGGSSLRLQTPGEERTEPLPE